MAFELRIAGSEMVLATHATSYRLWALLVNLAFALIIPPNVLALPQHGSNFDYSAIEAAIQRGDLNWAQQELGKRVAVDRRDYEAQMLLGIVLDEENHPAEAAEHLRRAVQLEPRSAAAHLNLGKHDARAGDLPASITEFESALRLSPSDPSAHDNLGVVLMAQGNMTRALAEFQQAAAADPGAPPTWLNLFKCQLALKQFPGARTSAEKIASLPPHSAELLSHLGALQADAGDYSGAIETLNRCLLLNPQDYQARYNLGLAYYHAGNLGSAVESLEPLRPGEQGAEVDSLLGEIYEKKRDYLEAVRSFQKAAERAPGNEEYRFDFVCELLAHRDDDAAILVGEPAVRDFPNSMRLSLALGVARIARGLVDDATKDFLRTAKQFPDDEQPLNVLALAEETAHKNLPETRELVQSYSDRHPDRFWPYYYLGHVAFLDARISQSADDLRKARRLLARSLEIRPDYADAHLELGNVYAQDQRWPEAVEEYLKTVNLKPDLAEAHYKLYRAYLEAGDKVDAQQQLEMQRKLREREDQQDLHQRQVSTFLYQIRETHPEK
jgi:tetratricopeptide (TPR) repeat protein